MEKRKARKRSELRREFRPLLPYLFVKELSPPTAADAGAAKGYGAVMLATRPGTVLGSERGPLERLSSLSGDWNL